MRLSLLYLLTFFIINIANAQGPTITATSEPVAGDIITYANTGSSSVALPATGTDITWDYSALVNSGNLEIDTFLTSSSTPYASFFLGSNLAHKSNGNDFYEYLQTTASDWSLLGDVFLGIDTTIYQSPLSLFHFPISYGTSYIDSALYRDDQGLKDSAEEIIYSEAVGYGTLKLPGHTYTNVLMVKDLITYRHAFGSFIDPVIYFLAPAVHSFIMEIIINEQNTPAGASYVTTDTITHPTTYTFNGNGNWSNAANWMDGIVPPLTVPSGTQVVISPQAGNPCNLDVQVTFSEGATLTVAPGAIFNIMGNLIIIK